MRQQTSLLNQAADQRDRACRDARQNAGIAYNDVVKLEEQLRALDRNVLAIEKARDAYRQQFDIGQRSLLDLLNSENELYTARRSYANADFDRLFAQARVLAAMQQLTQRLGSARADDGHRCRLRQQLERRRRRSAALPGGGGRRDDHAAQRTRPARPAHAQQRGQAAALTAARRAARRGAKQFD